MSDTIELPIHLKTLLEAYPFIKPRTIEFGSLYFINHQPYTSEGLSIVYVIDKEHPTKPVIHLMGEAIGGVPYAAVYVDNGNIEELSVKQLEVVLGAMVHIGTPLKEDKYTQSQLATIKKMKADPKVNWFSYDTVEALKDNATRYKQGMKIEILGMVIRCLNDNTIIVSLYG